MLTDPNENLFRRPAFPPALPSYYGQRILARETDSSFTDEIATGVAVFWGTTSSSVFNAERSSSIRFFGSS